MLGFSPMCGTTVLAVSIAVQSTSPFVSDPAGASAARERAEDARRACCPQQERCSEPIPELDACYIQYADHVFADYRRAFDLSNATDLDALRRCHELATRIVEQRTEQVGQPVCTHDGEVARACEARFAAHGCDRKALGFTSPTWWEPLLQGANLADGRAWAEARRRFAEAYELYLTSTGASGQFLEAWNILRESLRATFSACGNGCAPGQLRLGEVLAEMDRLFDRFHQGCHDSSLPEVQRVCEERNSVRAEHALTLVRVDGLYLEAADGLEAAYRDCTALVGERDVRRIERVLSCWRSFGRRSVWLRSDDADGTGRSAANPQRHRARTLVGEFVRDMRRDCEAGTKQIEVTDACAYLQAVGVAHGASPSESKGSTVVLPMRSGPAGMPLSASATDPARLLESPIYDTLLNPRALAPGVAREQLAAVERGLASQQAEQAASGIDCTSIDSPQAARMCAAARLLHRTQSVVFPVSQQITTPAPVVSPLQDSLSSAKSCRHCRAAGIAVLGVAGAGLAVAGIAALITIRNERDLRMLALVDPPGSAEELRASGPFRTGEAMNRFSVAGLVVAGAGAIVGTTILVVEAVRRRSGRIRVRVSSGGLGVAF